MINIARQGDEIVSANNLYGGTYTMFNDILPHQGITTKFVDINDFAAVKAAIGPKTRLLFCETIGNPALDVANIRELAAIARAAQIPLVVDSTFTTPFLLKPIEHGANIVIHSLTKWMGGHGTVMGGIVVDGGNFDWKNPKFALFNEPESSYHGLRFAHDLGGLQPLAYALRLRLVPLRNLGACISPDNAWQILQGIETLNLRMQRHCDNALAAATFLKSHPAVKWVRYPGLAGDPANATAKQVLQNGFGAMVVFGIQGGQAAGQKFIESLKLFSHCSQAACVLFAFCIHSHL